MRTYPRVARSLFRSSDNKSDIAIKIYMARSMSAESTADSIVLYHRMLKSNPRDGLHDATRTIPTTPKNNEDPSERSYIT